MSVPSLERNIAQREHIRLALPQLFNRRTHTHPASSAKTKGAAIGHALSTNAPAIARRGVTLDKPYFTGTSQY